VELGVLPTGRLAVLDSRRRRVTIFQVARDGRSLSVERIVALTIAAESMCVLADGKVLIYGLANGQRLHVVDTSGSRLRSFAPADSQRSRIAQDMLTQGRIACDPAKDEVVVTSVMTPLVEAFRISGGQPLWADTLRPFRPLRLTDQRGTVSVASPPSGYSRVSGASIVGDYLAFQTTFDARMDGASVDTVVTYLYSRSKGGWMSPTLALPLFFPISGGEVLSEATGNGTGAVELSRVKIAGGSAPPR